MKKQMGRLAMRRENSLWVAYYALPDTMDGALFLGSIRMAAVENNQKRKEAFMAMMKDLVSDIIAEKLGERPTWSGPKPAPNSERGGNA